MLCILFNRTLTRTTEVPPPTAATAAPPPRLPALPIASCVVPSRVSVHVMYSRSDPVGGGRVGKLKTSPIYRVNGVRCEEVQISTKLKIIQISWP